MSKNIDKQKIQKLEEIVSMATPFMTPKDAVIAKAVLMLLEGFVDIKQDIDIPKLTKSVKFKNRFKKILNYIDSAQTAIIKGRR